MNNLLLALEITALGMGLVFAAIILLWLMMSLLTSLTADKRSSASGKRTGSDSAESTLAMGDEFKAEAAAVAVAMALAEQQTSMGRSLSEPPTAIVSAWQLGMRTRQMYQKGPIRRPRKIG